jgi:AcrR family transcriptional regulator
MSVDGAPGPRSGGAPGPRRLRQDDRRRQLIGLGLEILATKPIHALSLDEVAARAGISRGLLFHYFPTKQDYYAAVVRAASRRLLGAAQADPGVPAAEQLGSIVAAYVRFIDRHLAAYTAFFRGGAGADAQVQAIYDEVRDELTDRALAAYGAPTTPVHRMAVRGWWSLVENMAVDRAADHTVTPDVLVTYVVGALPGLLTSASIIGEARGSR